MLRNYLRGREVAVRSKASGKRAAPATHLAMEWLVTLSVSMLVLIQSWSLCAAQLTSSQLFLLPDVSDVSCAI